ncbi:MAG TPA: aldolase/citrate lyase family protein [Planctomycetota bacterium]
MIYLLITNDPEAARRAEAAGVDRLFVDLEIMGKRERQGGRDTVISGHTFEDIRRVRTVLSRARLLVRVNPPNAGTAEEVELALAAGAQLLMLPMFRTPEELRGFADAVRGRVPAIGLIETKEAAERAGELVRVPGMSEFYVGLNDLHLALGKKFMFEPLADGTVDALAASIRGAGLPFGFGGIARVGEGLLPAEKILGEHLRLGSTRVILSRTFQRGKDVDLALELRRLREAEAALARRTAEEVEENRRGVRTAVEGIVRGLIA